MKRNESLPHLCLRALGILALAASLVPVAAVGDSSAAQNIQAITDQMNAQIEEERKRAQERARDEANKTTQQNTIPDMIARLAKAAAHKKAAEDARQQQNFGKAEEEEKKAMMEQMKAQQQDQQRQANDKSARENDKGAQKMLNQEPIKAPALPANHAVTSLRDEAYRADRSAQETYTKASPEPTPSIPKEELANLASISIPVASPKPEPTPSAAPSDSAPRVGETSKFGYDEDFKVADKAASPTAASGFGPPVTGVAAGGPSGGLSAAGGTGEFWSSVGGFVDAENKQLAQAENKLSMKGLRGVSKKSDEEDKNDEDLPGSGLSDAQFWKKVGKEPAKCRASIKLSDRKRTKCLRLARRDLERKWRSSNRRPASTTPKSRDEAKPSTGAKVAEQGAKAGP